MPTQDYHQPKVIAEIGCNHKGDYKIAKELITLAKKSGANYAKFQKRNPKELLTTEQYYSPHPHPWNSYGHTYGEHRENLEFSIEQHSKLKNYCDKIGIQYATSVWDVTSALQIIELTPEYIKVPSACNNNFALLRVLRDSYKGDIHVSLGMTTKSERENVVKFFEETSSAKSRLILYACTSAYPVPLEFVSLLEIKKLFRSYGKRVKEIGFSGHHEGTVVDIAAYTLGATWIERHFTKDRTWKGTDHAASLEPPFLTKLVDDLKDTFKSLTYKSSSILEIESEQRKKLKFRISN